MKKRNNQIFNKVGFDENPFVQSTGDLMAGLLLIFILILASTLLRLEDEFKQKAQFAQNYKLMQEELYKDLEAEFHEDLKKWNADLNPNTLSIRFKEPDVLFEQGQASVKDKFKEIMDDFFPRYIGVIIKPKYKASIEEIRIEGHTSSEWNILDDISEKDAYFKNMELSQNRTRNVLEYALGTIPNTDVEEWARTKITANGLSSSHTIKYSSGKEKGKENRLASRRVEFRVRTDAEGRISEFLKEWTDKNLPATRSNSNTNRG